jgi:hypothetical protein
MAGYLARIDSAPTLLAAGSAYHTLFNPAGSGKTLKVHNIDLQIGFAGVNVASRSTMEILRYAATAPAVPTGGAVFAAIKASPDFDASIALIRSADGGLGVVGLVLEEPFFDFSVTNQVNCNFNCPWLATNAEDKLVIPPGHGLLILADTVIVAGAYFTGAIHWEEF